ncbi:hypothetical protein DFH09DRAFT_1110497 [Mycena vulgaris]|nr:hypothetical protein DFH09DRAFT_1110497 [Mycena vulgaris]
MQFIQDRATTLSRGFPQAFHIHVPGLSRIRRSTKVRNPAFNLQELRARSKESIEIASECEEGTRNLFRVAANLFRARKPPHQRALALASSSLHPRARTARDALEPRCVLRCGVHAERKGVGSEANWCRPRPALVSRAPQLQSGCARLGVAREEADVVRAARSRWRAVIDVQDCPTCTCAVGRRRTARADVLGRADDKTWAGTRVERSNAAAMMARARHHANSRSRRSRGRGVWGAPRGPFGPRRSGGRAGENSAGGELAHKISGEIRFQRGACRACT